MRERGLIIMFSFGVSLGLFQHLYAWENKLTHPALTHEAIRVENNASKLDDYLKTQLSLNEGIKTRLKWTFPPDIEKRLKRGKVYPWMTTRSILEWMKAGSTIEDEDGLRWPIRSRHHFHDPTRNAGLDNQTHHYDWKDYACTKTGFDFTGESALTWATVGTAEKEPKVSYHSWENARDDFYQALILSGESEREEYLAITFLDLGHVLHMIEDMGVPAHTRNDFLFGHWRKFPDVGNPLEKWVEKEVIRNKGKIASEWLTGWTPQAKAFSKLAYYFDTNAYTGQYVGTSPASGWGLSEKTNYQFLSWSTMFVPEVFPWYTLYSFPQPLLENVGCQNPGRFSTKIRMAAGNRFPTRTNTVWRRINS